MFLEIRETIIIFDPLVLKDYKFMESYEQLKL